MYPKFISFGSCLNVYHPLLQRPMMKNLEIDMKGTVNRYMADDGTIGLNLVLGEVKSRNPASGNLEKAVLQLYKRMYLIAYASDAIGLSHRGKCTGFVFTSFDSGEKESALDALEKAVVTMRPWKANAPLLSKYSFDVRIREVV